MLRHTINLVLFTTISTYGEDQGCIEGDCIYGTGIYIDDNGHRLQGQFTDGKPVDSDGLEK